MGHPGWSDDIDAELARVARELDSARDRLSEVEARAEAAKGLVVVRVGPDHRVRELKLDSRVMRLGSHELAEAITQAVNSAVDEVAARTQEIVAPLMDGPSDIQDSTQELLKELDQRFGL
ncbi:YbaB/EbfC family nucleoid-associated protein [Streptosporangium sp. NBC_01639]|uniref:YbaB/EbfC family nucleoid-associated protein n=1 Tax=Streptosporangium sp. NBC_01639 TaxID=2975948 RepID=UPI0038698013|nr:YbaB/EbfC family nucleoid-associated protein [Streptosporangium sp. NBC_01639]